MPVDRLTPGAEWIRRVGRCHETRLRLVCLPHAGGAASFYNSWARWLPPGVELLTVQYPGRQDRITEPPISRMDELAVQVTQALQPYLARDPPLVLFGHSMGAWVAFEVVRRLEISFAHRPLGLIVSGQVAPHLPSEREWPDGSDEGLIAELSRIDGADTAPVLQPELRELVMPAIRSDFSLLREYSPQPLRRISTPVTAFAGIDDADVPWNKVAAWEDATTGSYVSHKFPGGHFYLVEHEEELAHEVHRTIRWLAGEIAEPLPLRSNAEN
ncbi:thioesterase II family protein [Streptomyces sp. NPDC050548]|uniref:thioesterase II family protein n=1 Tax=Streptomyces sp. NPDC050548 TaxID=3365629 RepID=UPI0037961A2E